MRERGRRKVMKLGPGTHYMYKQCVLWITQDNSFSHICPTGLGCCVLSFILVEHEKMKREKMGVSLYIHITHLLQSCQGGELFHTLAVHVWSHVLDSITQTCAGE